MKIVLVVEGGASNEMTCEYIEKICECADTAIQEAVVFYSGNDTLQHMEEAYNENDFDVYVAVDEEYDVSFADQEDVVTLNVGDVFDEQELSAFMRGR